MDKILLFDNYRITLKQNGKSVKYKLGKETK